MKWPTRVLIVATIIYIIVLAILILARYINVDKIFISIGAGLVAGLITYLFVHWLDEGTREQVVKCLQEIRKLKETTAAHDNQFGPHGYVTTTIPNVLQEKYLLLVKQSRRDLNSQYYSDLYTDTCRARVSGIALIRFIESLKPPSNSKKNHPLVEALTTENPDGVVVEALMAHPKSQFVQIRDKTERKLTGRSNPCSKDIHDIIKTLEGLATKYADTKLPPGNRLQIRLTYAPLDSAITYVKKTVSKSSGNDLDETETLLVGPIYQHDIANEGPIYLVPVEQGKGTMFELCIKNFDHIFREEAHTVFLWDSSGVQLHAEVADRDFMPES